MAMILKFIKKLTICLGLLLFFTLLIPQSPDYIRTVQAANLDKENKVPDYRLNLRNITLVINKSFTLKAYNLGENAKVSFKSNDSEIASVNDEGTITANKVGTTVITVTIKDGNNPAVPLTCDITVGPPAFSVRFTKSRIILGLDKTDLLKVILKPTNTAEVAMFSTYNEDIATVSPGGKVTAKKLGLTYLFAQIDTKDTIGFNKYATCTLIVTNPEDVTPLETYFNDHPELDQIPTSALYDALIEFFNGTSEKEAIVSTISAGSLVENFDKFLNEKFDFKVNADQETANVTENNQPEVISEKKLQQVKN